MISEQIIHSERSEPFLPHAQPEKYLLGRYYTFSKYLDDLITKYLDDLITKYLDDLITKYLDDLITKYLDDLITKCLDDLIKKCLDDLIRKYQCVSEPPRGRVSAELSKPVERKGAMCVVLV